MKISNIFKHIRKSNNGRLHLPYNITPACIRWKNTIRANKKGSKLIPIMLGTDKFKLFLEYEKYYITISNSVFILSTGNFVNYWKHDPESINLENIDNEELFNLSLMYDYFPSADEIKRIRKYMNKNNKNTITSILMTQI